MFNNIKPSEFFFFTYLMTWVSRISPAQFSFGQSRESIYVILILPRLIAPFGISFWMILLSKDKIHKKCCKNKLFDPLLLINGLQVSTAGKIVGTLTGHVGFEFFLSG